MIARPTRRVVLLGAAALTQLPLTQILAPPRSPLGVPESARWSPNSSPAPHCARAGSSSSCPNWLITATPRR
jgi:hypothetical protein